MITGKTNSGFEFEIAQDVIESWELVELLNDVEDNPVKVVKLVNFLLGTEQKKKLIEHLGGRPTIAEMNTAIAEIFTACKNNSSLKN